MNRRNFLTNLGIGAAALMIRFAPDSAASIPAGFRRDTDLEDGEYQVSFITHSGSFTRLAPERFDGLPLVLPPSLLNFTVKDGVITYEK